MRPLSRNRRLAAACASCAAILPGSAAVLSQRQIAGISHSHDLLTGIAFGVCIALLGTSIFFLKRDRSVCSRAEGTGA